MNRKNKFVITLAAALITASFVCFEVKSKNAMSSETYNANSPPQSTSEEKASAGSDAPKDTVTAVSPGDKDTEETENEYRKPQAVKHVIKPGDTLYAIARSYGVKVNTIAEANKLSLKSILRVGQELTIPSVDGILYKIKSGDTLWGLSSEYGTRIRDIVAVNNIRSPNRLKVGQVIIIPGFEKLYAGADTYTAVSADTKGDLKVAARGGVWPASGTISSMFGLRWGKHHNGVDIAAPVGTDVNAYKEGTVAFSGWNSGGYGYLVIIDHGDGLETYYAHNSKLLVEEGQSVSTGDHIAEVGSTGDSTGPHSHFEVRIDGVPVDPYDYLD